MASIHRSRTPLRYLLAAVLLGAAALGGSVLGDTAGACAAPQEWDIGSYDNCVQKADDNWVRGNIVDISGAHRTCCENTGGVWNAAELTCQAPPAQAPGAISPGQIGTNTLAPAPPPVVRSPGTIQTFTPVPAG